MSVVRLPQVHDTTRQGLITYAIAMAREKGVCPYVGDGQNRWPSAHILDTARSLQACTSEKERNAAPNTTRSRKRVCQFRDIAEGPRQTPEAAGDVDRTGTGRGPFRLARALCWSRCSGLQRAHAATFALAAHRTRNDRGSRGVAGLLTPEPHLHAPGYDAHASKLGACHVPATGSK